MAFTISRCALVRVSRAKFSNLNKYIAFVILANYLKYIYIAGVFLTFIHNQYGYDSVVDTFIWIGTQTILKLLYISTTK